MKTRYILENSEPGMLDRPGDYFLTVEKVYFEQEDTFLTIVLRVHEDEKIQPWCITNKKGVMVHEFASTKEGTRCFCGEVEWRPLTDA